MLSRELPLWDRLAQTLRAEIATGELPSGCQVRPEPALARLHGGRAERALYAPTGERGGNH